MNINKATKAQLIEAYLIVNKENIELKDINNGQEAKLGLIKDCMCLISTPFWITTGLTFAIS